MNNEYNFMIEMASYAKEVMNKYFIHNNGSSYKVDRTIVTLADKEINEYLIDQVNTKFPDYGVIGEENTTTNKEINFICDPVDGTAMYSRHIPVAVFSLALVQNGIPLIGVVYDPFTDKLYTAKKGEGAYCNNEKIEVSDFDLTDKESIINIDIWPSAEYNIIDVVKELNKTTYQVAIGSVIQASMHVAKGDFICCIFPGTIGKNYDIAAVKVIVEEAGGIVTDLFGNEQRYDEKINGSIISNKKVYNKVLDTINTYLENKKI